MAVVARVRVTAAPKGSYREVDCLASDEVGSCVYIRGDETNGRWSVETADPKDDTKMPAIGVLVSKSDTTVGIVQIFGACDLFTDMDPGRYILVGESGEVVDEVPSIGMGDYFWAQQIGLAATRDLLLLSGNQIMTRHLG